VTSRAAFGDITGLVAWHLDAATRRRPPPGRSPAALTSEAQELITCLNRLLPVIDRYLADITAAGLAYPGRPAIQWEQAASTATRAVRDARRHVTQAASRRAWPAAQPSGSATRDLDAAATAMTAGRDLLQTHFATGPDGTRRPRSEWAPFISSPAASRALLTEVAYWASQRTTERRPWRTSISRSPASTASTRCAVVSRSPNQSDISRADGSWSPGASWPDLIESRTAEAACCQAVRLPEATLILGNDVCSTYGRPLQARLLQRRSRE